MYRCALGTSLGSRLLRQKNAKISARETNRTKKSMSTTAQTYWPSSSEIWEGERNDSLTNEVDKDAISCFSIRKDWRFAVRAKSFALHWRSRSRGFFRGHVRSCEKGLWWARIPEVLSFDSNFRRGIPFPGKMSRARTKFPGSLTCRRRRIRRSSHVMRGDTEQRAKMTTTLTRIWLKLASYQPYKHLAKWKVVF